MVNTMARRTDGGVRFRPVGSRRSRTAPVYSPRGTGCPAIEQAVQGLYKGQNEESFWTLMSALNYALELETHVLVPLQTALSAQGAPAPWMEHPIPAEKADGLALWTLRNDKGRCWLPLFTSVAAAGADRSTASCPMADRTLEQAMQLALDTPGIDGVVLDPWSNSASLDGALLNGLLHAGHTPEGPGAEEAEAGKEAARAGHWAAAAECYQKAAEQGNSAGLSLLGECLYQGRGVPKSAAQARKMWKAAAESGEPIALLNLGDDCAARGDNGKALLWYRRARQNAAAVPDIEYTPRVCLRLAQYETRYTSRKKALAQAAEEKQAFTIVLESMLALLTFRFPKGCAGFNLDAIARAPFWSRGMDYNHGTGHGVGYMLSVHEGPNGIRGQRRVKSEDAEFVPGMITSDEPGIYIEGKYGVRHENLMECVEAEPGSRYLEFRSITFAPIDLDAIDEDTLTETARLQLNAYHKEVYAKLAPHMGEEELVWLKEYTREI